MRRLETFALAGALIGALIVGCAADDSDGDQAPNVQTPTAPVETGEPIVPPPNPATCSNVTRSGLPVAYHVMRLSPPAPLGGAIVPGEYELREVVVYDASEVPPTPAEDEQPLVAADARVAQKNIVLAQDHFRLATGDGALGESGFATETLSAGWYQVDGTNLNVTGICPTRATATIPYTATPYQVVLFPEPGVAEFYSLR